MKINGKDKIARIPAEFIEQALKTAPKSFVLGARNPIHNFPIACSIYPLWN